jgi:recombination protein U
MTRQRLPAGMTRAQQMPRNNANRGSGLENMIEHTWRTYAAQGVGCGQKVATPTKQDRREGKFYREPSTVDFIGVVHGIAVAFDAKENTSRPSMALDRIKHHQARFLRDYRKAGGVAFVLIDFGAQAPTFYAAELDALETLAAGKKSVSVQDMETAAGHAMSTGVVAIPRGKGVAVPFGPAAQTLWRRHPNHARPGGAWEERT